MKITCGGFRWFLTVAAVCGSGVMGFSLEAQGTVSQPLLELHHAVSDSAPATGEVPATQGSTLWSPAERPTECLIVEPELIELDISGSMRVLFPSAVRQIETYIDAAPRCTYLILASFGITSDVLGDGFILEPADRARLKESLRGLLPTQSKTNFDEAARLAEWVQLKLEKAYAGAALRLSVRVLTDGVSDPSEGKARFDLKEYFETNLASKPIDLLTITLIRSGQSDSVPADLHADQRYGQVTIPVNLLAELLQRTTTAAKPENTRVTAPDSATAPAPTSNPAAQDSATKRGTESRSPASGAQFWPRTWILPAVAGILSLIIVLSLVGWWLAKPDPEVEDNAGEQTGSGAITGLLFDERELPEDGTLRGVKVLRQRQRTPVISSVPVTFGTNPETATVITTPVAGVRSADLFKVTVVPGGFLRIESAGPELLCNGQPLGEKGITLSGADLCRIRIANREWTLNATGSAERGALPNAFAALRTRRAAGDAVSTGG